MQYDLSTFSSIGHGKRGNQEPILSVHPSGVGLSACAVRLLGEPKRVSIRYSQEHHAFLVRAAMDGERESFALPSNRQITSSSLRRVISEIGVKEGRFVMEAVDGGFVVPFAQSEAEAS
jgi:hypothetical protein